MPTRLMVSRLSAAALAMVLFSGCGGGNTASVTGTVTMDGQPLPNAYVVFNPQSLNGGGGGRPAAGKTDSQGYYELIYGRGTTGAVPGTYRVEIRTYVEPNPDADTPEEQAGAPELVPAKYNAHSELKATVDAGGSEIDFQLDSEGEIVLPDAGGYGGGYGGG